MAEKKGGEPKAKATRLKVDGGFRARLLKRRVTSYDFKWGISGN